ncbi:hypothetical protein LPMP_291290 [Leishmania panamensis]|uniref:Uncharacterized protein n=1 Tax=Leishmania panamensis TaxID=5679 RepID=A0A088RXS7_LEIPA|nr:hypothetical protein LPMP_291290 [Leishmania panamensis]AIO00080.1 hypothetical protein LPMP_291290 [Leishmania panamensis]
MPSTYAHEPDIRTLVAITRCVSAMQHSEVQSCAALFTDTHHALTCSSCTSHARALREVTPACYASGTREPLPDKQRSATMRRNGWPHVARSAPVFEVSPLPPPPTSSRHTAHQESSAFLSSRRLAGESVRAGEYVLEIGSDRNASDARYGGAHHTQSAASRAYGSFGFPQDDRHSIKRSTGVRGIHFRSSDDPGASRAASRVPLGGTAARADLPFSMRLSHLHRQPPSPSRSEADGATSGFNAHSLRLNISADVENKSSRASRSDDFTLFSLGISKVNGVSRISRADPASFMDEMCTASHLNLAQASTTRNSSHATVQPQLDCWEQHASSRSSRWMTSQGGEGSLVSPLQKLVHHGSAAPSVAASRSPPSVTAAVARNGRSVTSYDTEALWSSVRSAGAHAPPQSSRASAASRSSYPVSSLEHGGRRRASDTTSVRCSSHTQETATAVAGSSVPRILSHASLPVAVVATADDCTLDARRHLSDAVHDSSSLPRDPQHEGAEQLGFPSPVSALSHVASPLQILRSGTRCIHNSTTVLTCDTPPQPACAPRNAGELCLVNTTSSPRKQRHPADRGTDVVSVSALGASLDHTQCATHAASGELLSADRAPSHPAVSSPDLERCPLLEVSTRLLSASSLAFTASETSPVSLTSRSLRFSPPSAATVAVPDGVCVVEACPSQKSAQTREGKHVRHEAASHTSAASFRASASASASISTSAKSSLFLAEASTMRPDVLSRPAVASASAARRQYPPSSPLPSACFEPSSFADLQRAGGSPQRSLSLHSSCGAEPGSERREDGPLAPPVRTRSPSYSIPRRRRSSLKGAAAVSNMAERAAQSLASTVMGTCDVARLVQSTADENWRIQSNPTGLLGRGGEVLSDVIQRPHTTPPPESIGTADEPLTAVSEVEDDVAREEGIHTSANASSGFSREGSEEGQGWQQQQQPQQRHRFLGYVPPVRGPGASPLNQRSVAAAATHRGKAPLPLPTSPTSSATALRPPLAYCGNRGRRFCGGSGDNTSAGLPTNNARREVHEAASRSRDACPCCSPRASNRKMEHLSRGEATTTPTETPEHPRLSSYLPSLVDASGDERDTGTGSAAVIVHLDSRDAPSLAGDVIMMPTSPTMRSGAVRLISPARSHAAVTSLRESEEGRVSYRRRGCDELQVGDLDSKDVVNDSCINDTEVHRPGGYHRHRNPTTRSSVASILATHHTPCESLHSVSSDFDWVMDDYAAQQRLQSYADDEGSLTVPLPLDTTVTESPPELTALETRESSFRRGCALGSQTPAAPPLTCATVVAEDLRQNDPTLQVRSAASSTSHFALLLCTSSNLQPPCQNSQHSPHTSVLGSLVTNSNGSLCMDSFASLEHTPAGRSITNEAAMENSATGCDAPAMSTFFAGDHVADATPAAVAVRGVAEERDERVAGDVLATETPVMEVDAKLKSHARTRLAMNNSEPVLRSSVKQSSSPGSRNTDLSSRVTHSAVHTPGDVCVGVADTTPSISSATRNELAAGSQSSLLDSRLHSNSVFKTAWRRHTQHEANTAVSRGVWEVHTRPSTALSANAVADSRDGDDVENRFDDVPTLRDRYTPCPTPVLGIDGCDTHLIVPSESTPPPPPGVLRKPGEQLHQPREASLCLSSAHLIDTEDNATALKSMAIAQEIEGQQTEVVEASRRRVAPELSSSPFSINAASSTTAASLPQRGRHPGERQEDKREPDDLLETDHRQCLQQREQHQQVRNDYDDGAQSQTLCGAHGSDFLVSRSYPGWSSVSTQPYDTEGSHSRGDMQDELPGEPIMIMNAGGGGSESCGDCVVSAPSSPQSREGSMRDKAVVDSAAAESREGELATPAHLFTKAMATTRTTVTTTPEYHPSASGQRTHLSVPAAFSKPPMGSGVYRPLLGNVLRCSSAYAFRGGDSVVPSEEAGSHPRRQWAMAAAADKDAHVAEADGFGAEVDDDEDGGYCTYGYESDLIYV